MAQNIGTLISAAIRPNDSLDPIASAYASEIKGGLHTVTSSTDRDNIIPERREWGMLCYVINDKKTYQLAYAYVNINIMDNSNWVEYGNSAGSTGVSSTWLDSVIKIELTQPATPSLGDRYLVGVRPGNSISGSYWTTLSEPGFVAEWNGIFWDITYPEDGFSVRVNDQDNSIYRYEGTYNTNTGYWVKEKMNQVRSILATSTDGINYTSVSEPNFDSYSDDIIFLTKFDTINIGMTASLNINGEGNSYIKKSTSNGVVSLNNFDIKPDVVYSLVYDTTNNYFLLTKPSNDDLFNIKYYIGPTEYIIVPENYQYWVYGDLIIEGIFDNYGQVVISNGNLILNGGSYSNYGPSSSLSFVNSILDANNGLELINDVVGLGGTLSRDTYIDGDGYNFINGNINTLMFTSSVFDVESDLISLDSGSGSFQMISGSDTTILSSGNIDLISNDSVNITGPTFSVNNIIIDPTTPNINDVLKFDGVKFRSLPDSGSSVDNGLEVIGVNIGLGGTLSRPTIINGDEYDLIIGDIDTLMFTSSVFDVESDLISLDSGSGSFQMISGSDATILSSGNIDLISSNNINLIASSFSVNYIEIDPTSPNINDVLKFNGSKFISSPEGGLSVADNGLEIISNSVGLGGTISRPTNIYGNEYNLILGNFNTLLFTSSVFDIESNFISLDSGTGSFQIMSGDNMIITSDNDLDLISTNSVNVITSSFSVNSVEIDPTSPTLNSVLMFDGIKFKPTMSNNTYGTTYFVTPDGDDSVARVGDISRPFGTISGARDAAVFDGLPTSLIYVYPGVYFDEEIQYENGNFFFSAGAIIKLPKKFNGSNGIISTKVILTDPILQTIEISGNWSSVIIPGYKFKINTGPNARIFTTVSSINSGSNTIITTQEIPDISTLGSLISKTNIFTMGTLASIGKIILPNEIYINSNWLSKFITGYKFKIDSGDNAGIYTVSSSTYDSSIGKTKVVVDEIFTSTSKDGFVYDEFSDIPIGSTMYTTKHHSKKCSVYGFGKFIIEETLDNDWSGAYIEAYGGTNFYGELDSITQIKGVCIGSFSDSIVTIKGNFLEVTIEGYVSSVRDSSDTTFQFQRISASNGYAFFVRQGTDLTNYNGSCIISADVIISVGNMALIAFDYFGIGGYVSLICPKIIVDNGYFLTDIRHSGGNILVEGNLFTTNNGGGISTSGNGGSLSFKGNIYLKSNVAVVMSGDTNFELFIDGDILIEEGIVNSIIHNSGKLRLNGSIKNIATLSNPITNGILISDSINRSLVIDNLKIIANDNSITSGDPLLVIPNKFKVIHSLSSNVPLLKTENIIVSTPVTIDINIE